MVTRAALVLLSNHSSTVCDNPTYAYNSHQSTHLTTQRHKPKCFMYCTTNSSTLCSWSKLDGLHSGRTLFGCCDAAKCCDVIAGWCCSQEAPAELPTHTLPLCVYTLTPPLHCHPTLALTVLYSCLAG